MTDIKTTLKELPESEIEILCEVPVETFEKERSIALKKVGEEVSLPGNPYSKVRRGAHSRGDGKPCY